MALAKTFKELRVWQNAMNLAMKVFELSRAFPTEEKYSVTDQMRRSSRAVAAIISEAWRRRRYVAAFVNKLNEAEAEAAETQTWVEVVRRCQYIDERTASDLDAGYEEVLAQLVAMIDDAPRWCLPPRT